MRRIACALAALLSAGCATAPQPRVIALEETRAQPVRLAAWITDYERAAVSIASVMERDLRLPRLRAALHFHANRNEIRAALEAEGHPPHLARGIAATMAAIGGFRSVLLNEEALMPLNWPSRTALLAHELAHTAQYELSGGRRGTSEQWLREGYADWIQAYVLEALGVTTRQAERAGSIRRLRAAGDPSRLPDLSDMATFPQWVELHGGDARPYLYAYAFAATDFLVGRHGFEAATRYFRLFAGSNDPAGNFAAAFGEPRESFDAALREHVTGLLR